MIAFLLTLLLAAPPELKVPLLMTIRQSVGMAPLTLRVKLRAEAEGREACIVVDGPESFRSCRTLDGVTWTTDFQLRSGGEYAVYAVSGPYRTPDVPVRVIGLGGGTVSYRAKAVLIGRNGFERVITVPELPPHEWLVPVHRPWSWSLYGADATKVTYQTRVFRLEPALRCGERWMRLYNEGRSQTPEDGYVYTEVQS